VSRPNELLRASLLGALFGGEGSATVATAWLAERRDAQHNTVAQLPLTDVEGWRFGGDCEMFFHESGRFYQVIGVASRDGLRDRVQPMIRQDEIGVLGGVIIDGRDGPSMLVQAKFEPGNPDGPQVSPTVQATQSNFLRVHGGAATRYFEYFDVPTTSLYDQLQSEQGGRFYRKRNRNVLVHAETVPEVRADYHLLPLADLPRMLAIPNAVNMAARSLIAALMSVAILEGNAAGAIGGVSNDSSFRGELLRSAVNRAEFDAVRRALALLTQIKFRSSAERRVVPLSLVCREAIPSPAISPREDEAFRVIGVRVTSDAREVRSWCQPLIESTVVGAYVLLAQRRDGVLRFLIHARAEIGLWDSVELGPTVQLSDVSRGLDESTNPVSELRLYVATVDMRFILASRIQSEEGGRFYRSEIDHRVLLVPDGERVPESIEHVWLTLRELGFLLQANNVVSNELRSLMAILLSVR
jgi:oxidase EvaA